MTVPYSYYTSCYCGTILAGDEYEALEKRACMTVDRLIRGRLRYFDSFPENTQVAVKNAICSQIEYMALHGADITVAGNQSGGFTVGKVSVNNGFTGAASMVAPSSIAFLEITGLMNPSVDVWDWGRFSC